jgi:hypothetical protein
MTAGFFAIGIQGELRSLRCAPFISNLATFPLSPMASFPPGV